MPTAPVDRSSPAGGPMTDARGGATPGGVAVPVADEGTLAALAAALAAVLPTRAFLALEGDLGAGKTTFVKALAAAAGIDPAEVVSPTFGIVHLHDLPAGHPAHRLVHADLYRLQGPADLGELGWEELLAAPGWIAAEWPSRAAAALPSDRLDVTIDIVSETARVVRLTPRGPVHATVLEALARHPGARGSRIGRA